MLLAGCLSASDQPLGSADTNASVAQTAEAGPVRLDAGGSARPLVARAFPFEYEGATDMYMCAPAGPNSCAAAGGLPGENSYMPLVKRDAPLGINATLTWSATTPPTEELLFRVSVSRDCDDACMPEDWQSVEVRGVSPLSISAFEFRFEEGDRFALTVAAIEALPEPGPPIMYSYSVRQEFAVAGEVVALDLEPLASQS